MRVSLESIVVIIAALATAAFAIVAAMWMARRRRDVALRQHGNPLLVMPMNFGVDGGLRIPTPGTPARRPSPIRAVAIADQVPPDAGLASTNDVRVPLSGPISTDDDPISGTTVRFEPGGQAAEVVLGHSLRFHRPPDGTLALLPGHLVVIGGPDAGHEVRFVRANDSEPQDITFGRKEGPPYRHIQLLEPTVSRTHARMSRDGDRWRLTNLSRTNPVIVNGMPLDGVSNSLLLADNAVVEMGALVFRFYDR
jgi:hypothetical protein